MRTRFPVLRDNVEAKLDTEPAMLAATVHDPFETA
jgi:hypothetical protein